jgi:hypothetical protein
LVIFFSNYLAKFRRKIAEGVLFPLQNGLYYAKYAKKREELAQNYSLINTWVKKKSEQNNYVSQIQGNDKIKRKMTIKRYLNLKLI